MMKYPDNELKTYFFNIENGNKIMDLLNNDTNYDQNILSATSETHYKPFTAVSHALAEAQNVSPWRVHTCYEHIKTISEVKELMTRLNHESNESLLNKEVLSFVLQDGSEKSYTLEQTLEETDLKLLYNATFTNRSWNGTVQETGRRLTLIALSPHSRELLTEIKNTSIIFDTLKSLVEEKCNEKLNASERSELKKFLKSTLTDRKKRLQEERDLQKRLQEEEDDENMGVPRGLD
jgi:hypothetical protein